MELELQQEHFACYHASTQLCDTHEETLETIVPDYCPDIARIVDASGCLFLRKYELTDGKVSVSGSIKMTLLYMAEDGIRSLDYAIPLDYTLEERLSGASEVMLEGKVDSCEVRMLNPRKVFSRISVKVCVTPYAPATITACGGVVEKEKYKVETLSETHEVSLIQAVREKDFVFSEEVVLSSAKEPIRDILRAKSKLRVTECKSVGSKLILKGIACLDMLYLTQGGTLAQLSSELPFSQIIDGPDDGGGELSCDASLRLTSCEIRIGSENAPDDAHTVSIKLMISAFVLLRKTQKICCIADLYSTAYDLNAKSEQVQLSPCPETFVRTQTVREQIETGVAVQSILCADVSFGSAALVQSDAGSSTLRTSALIKVLYLDESGSPLLAERRVEVTLDTDVPAALGALVRCVCAGDVSASISANGIEVRFPTEFTLISSVAPCYPCLMALSAEQRKEPEGETPSLVLRMLKRGESLWNLAKQYRTTVDEILKANELTEEAAAAIGQMLLIPRKR